MHIFTFVFISASSFNLVGQLEILQFSRFEKVGFIIITKKNGCTYQCLHFHRNILCYMISLDFVCIYIDFMHRSHKGETKFNELNVGLHLQDLLGFTCSLYKEKLSSAFNNQVKKAFKEYTKSILLQKSQSVIFSLQIILVRLLKERKSSKQEFRQVSYSKDVCELPLTSNKHNGLDKSYNINYFLT